MAVVVAVIMVVTMGVRMLVAMIVRVSMGARMDKTIGVKPTVVGLHLVGIRADAFHMVVVALLRQTDFRLEAQNLRAIFAQAAVHLVLAHQDLLYAVGKGIEHQRVVLQILGMKELDLRVALGHLIVALFRPERF